MITLDKREKSLHTMYQEHGLLQFQNLYSREAIGNWNKLLDPVFNQSTSTSRSYVESDKLLELGILKQVMVPKLLNVISVLDPCPVFFHCCCFEIEGKQKQHHKFTNRLDGWHREPSDPRKKSVRGCRPYSIYIYLSDVNDTDNGSFEVIPQVSHWPTRE